MKTGIPILLAGLSFPGWSSETTSAFERWQESHRTMQQWEQRLHEQKMEREAEKQTWYLRQQYLRQLRKERDDRRRR